MKEILFAQFKQILDAYKPTNICEIGTHEGKSSGQFIGHLLETVGVEKLKYTGYDAFELMREAWRKTSASGCGCVALLLSLTSYSWAVTSFQPADSL